MRFVILIGILALGSGLASLVRDLPDPAPAMKRTLERKAIDVPGTRIWIVKPVKAREDSVFIEGFGYVVRAKIS